MFKNGLQFIRIVSYISKTIYLILLIIQRNIFFINENQKLYNGTLLASKRFASLSYMYRKFAIDRPGGLQFLATHNY